MEFHGIVWVCIVSDYSEKQRLTRLSVLRHLAAVVQQIPSHRDPGLKARACWCILCRCFFARLIIVPLDLEALPQLWRNRYKLP